MLRVDGDMLNPLNYSSNDIFLVQEETCSAIINPSVISVLGWLLHVKASHPGFVPFPTTNI